MNSEKKLTSGDELGGAMPSLRLSVKGISQCAVVKPW